MPVDLDSSMERWATSRTCLTAPGSPPDSGRNTVCTLSTTSRTGREARAVASMWAKSVWESRCSAELPTPRRSARRRICCTDSSPLT